MEKIEEFHWHSKFDNFSQHYDFVRPVNLPGNGRLQSYVGLTLLIILITICSRKVNGKLETICHNLNFKSINFSLLFIPIYYLLSCLTLPLIVIIIMSFVIIRQIVNIILTIKHGDSFGGILKSADAVWALEDTSRSIINVLVILKIDNTKNVVNVIKQAVFEKIFQNPETFLKLTSIRQRFMGYNYLLKNRLTVDDCVRSLGIKGNEELSQTLLQEIISEYSNRPLPKDNSALWEILVSPVPTKWNSADESANFYPLLMRFSHIVADGSSFTNVMLRTFANSKTLESYKKICFGNQYINNLSKHSRKRDDIFSKSTFVFKRIINLLNSLLVASSVIFQELVLRKNDENSLHGPKLSGKKILVYAVEHDSTWFNMVKDIKKNIPDCKFSDVLLAAISGSLEKHFKKDNQSVPKFVSAVIPALLSAPNMDEELVLQNQFSVGILDLPIQMKNSLMSHRLREVMKCTREFRKSPQFQVNYWLVTYLCGLIPQQILQHSLKTDHITMTISNLPGVPKMTVIEDIDIEDIVFFTNHKGKTGIGFTILTYDNRFQLGLIVDKSIMTSKEKVQMLINWVLKNIESLQKEVCGPNVSMEM